MAVLPVGRFWFVVVVLLHVLMCLGTACVLFLRCVVGDIVGSVEEKRE